MIIGLTGNIATGKSTVRALAAAQGAYTIDADRVVHDLYAADQVMLNKLHTIFGDRVFHSDKIVDRVALGEIVFQNKDALHQLEAIVHPAVRLEVDRRISLTTSTIIFIEAIKLLQSPIAMRCQQIWVTTCATKQQINRLITHRGMNETAAKQRVHSQLSQDEKIKHADVIIDTTGTINQTINQFNRAWEQLQSTIQKERQS